ncbi:MAG: polyhydroxyalkanoic acid system family protein [Methylovirgula sp.]|nr:polyhydroxyalkanoic acid system family protein [Methylovirgula sp.]
MAKPIVISVPHSLGVDEAQRRIAAEIDQLKDEYINKFAHSEIAWAGNTANIRVIALAQEIKARIDVLADSVRIEVILPWLLAKLAAPALDKLTATTQETLSLGYNPKKS